MKKGFSFDSSNNKNGKVAPSILYNNKPFAHHKLSFILSSSDGMDRVEINEWQGENVTIEGDKLIISGTDGYDLLGCDVDIAVEYQAIGENVFKKTIKLYQNDASRLMLYLKSSLKPLEKIEKYWSFDSTNHEGGIAYGGNCKAEFPAVGFVFKNGIVAGLLTDTGYENGWGRWTTRRSYLGNISTINAFDPALFSCATQEERAVANDYICANLGESYTTVQIPIVEQDNILGFFGREGFSYTLAFASEEESDLTLEITYEDGCEVKTFKHEEKSPVSNSMHFIFKLNSLVKNGLYKVRILKQNGESQVVDNVRIFEQSPLLTPWQQLELGKEITRSFYVFAEEFEPNIRNLRYKSQIYLAESLGFKGNDTEKIIYADFKMLTWVLEPGLNEPLVSPSIEYFEMYFRDMFWIMSGSQDKFLNENILRRIEATMNKHGHIDNIITPYYGSREHTNNEIDYLYIIWSYLNKKRFDITPNYEQINKITQVIKNEFDPDGDGIIYTTNPQSLMDVMWYDKEHRFAVSQGYFAVAMRAAKELGADIDEEYICKAEEGYRGYYDDYGTLGKYLHSFPDNTLGENGTPLGIISCLDLEPEFLSLYLFNKAILTDEMVINTLEKLPIFNDCLMPIMCRADGKFFTKDCNPFSHGLFWEGGRYANGGSYLRPQYIALAAGHLHGWNKALDLMEKRMKIEIEFDVDNPTSHEYLSCNGDPDKSSDHRVFAWNMFVIEINRFLSLSKQEYDPDDQGNKLK